MLFVWIIVILVVLVIGYAVITYNGLVSMRNRIENAWAQIDVQLKRRYDLIPNLVETVKGYASHEREHPRGRRPGPQHGDERPGPAGPGRRREHDHRRAQERVRPVRRPTPTSRRTRTSSTCRRSSPAPRAGSPTRGSSTTTRCTRYNTKIQSVPSNIIANQFNFDEREYFEVDEASRGNVAGRLQQRPRGRSRRHRRRPRRPRPGRHRQPPAPPTA